MKKVVFGVGLFICGALSVLAGELRQAIFFASPNGIATLGGERLTYIGVPLFLAGLVIAIWGLGDYEKKK